MAIESGKKLSFCVSREERNHGKSPYETQNFCDYIGGKRFGTLKCCRSKKDALIDELSPTIAGGPEYCAGPWPKEFLCFRTIGDVIY
jgi:hypothetical protein